MSTVHTQMRSGHKCFTLNSRGHTQPSHYTNFSLHSNMSASSSSIYKELMVPEKAVGLLIGKGGSTIRGFRQSPGISSVTYSSGKVYISGHSEEAVQAVASSIQLLLAGFAADKAYYFPDFFALCFCKSVENPLRAVTRVCFQKIPSELSSKLYEAEDDHRQETKPYFFYKLGEGKSNNECSMDSIDNLSAEFRKKTYISVTDTLVFSHWGFSAYKSKLAACLEPLLSQQRETMRTIKLIVRFGKLLFFGENCSQLHNGGFMSLPSLRELNRRRYLKQRFSAACTETAIKQSLEALEYVKVPSGKKISLHVSDFESNLKQNVSIRCDGDQYGALFQNSEMARIASATNYFEVLGVDADGKISEAEVRKAYRRCTIRIQPDVVGRTASEAAIGIVKEAYECLLDPAKRHEYFTKNVRQSADGKALCPALAEICREEERAEITRVRKQPRRHAFVAFLREGLSSFDFRLGISSHGEEAMIGPEMGKWVENAWQNRTPDQFLVFEPTNRFTVLNVRYKQTETYMTEAWKFRISRVCGEDGRSNAKWEYALSSRWFKQKCRDGMNVCEMESIMDNVSALVAEAAKLSKAMVG